MSLARARTYYNFSNPCHRCRLAKLLDNQTIGGNNVAATVTTIGDFAWKVGIFCLKKEIKTGWKPDYSLSFGRERELRSMIPGIGINHSKHRDILSETRGYFIPCHGTKCSTLWNKVFHPMEQTGRWHILGSKCRLQGEDVIHRFSFTGKILYLVDNLLDAGSWSGERTRRWHQ